MHLVIKYLITFLCAGWLSCGGHPLSADTHQIFLDGGTVTASTNQHKALTEAEIIPDVLDDFKPSVSIEIFYSSKHKVVDLGNSIKPKRVTSQPIFSIYSTDQAPTPTRKSNATYVLALTDPDATSRSDPVKAQMCHWIVTNITLPLHSSVTVDLSGFSAPTNPRIKDGGSGINGINEIMPYVPPTPPPKTGYHRYVFVVLASNSQDNELEVKKPEDRPHWGYGKVGAGLREWAEDNSLVVLGANFFYSKDKKQ